MNDETTDSAEALADWSHAVRQLATRQFNRSAAQAISNGLRKNHLEITPAVAQDWLDGRDAPRDVALHTELMLFLGMKKTLSDIPGDVFTGPQYRTALTRSRIEEDYASALPLLQQRPPLEITAATQPRHRAVLGKPKERVSTAKRIDPTGQYPAMSEFLRNIRATHRWTQEQLAAQMGLLQHNVAQYESGRSIPESETLDRIRVAMKPTFAPYFRALEDTMIAESLRHIVTAQAKQETLSAGQHIYRLPVRYWQTALAQLIEPSAGEQASWAENVIPIATKQDYLRAMRLALGMGATEFAGIVHCDTNSILNMEIANSQTSVHSPVGQRALQIFKDHQHAHPNAVLFDQATWDRLPEKQTRSKAEEVTARRATAGGLPEH